MCGGKPKPESGKFAFLDFFRKHLWQICFAIGIFDLAHALYFVLQATISLIIKFNIYSSLALLGTIFWVLIVVLLIVGLWKVRPIFVKAWLIFSIVGFVADIVFLIWGIASSVTVDWDHLQEFTIIFVGIFIEVLCIYLVRCFYLSMDPCRLIDEPEKGKRQKKKKHLDEKACQDKSKTKSKSNKSNKSNKSSKKSEKKPKKAEKKKKTGKK